MSEAPRRVPREVPNQEATATVAGHFAPYATKYLAVGDGTAIATAVDMPFKAGHSLTELEARILSQAWLSKATSTAGSELTRNEGLKDKSDDEKRTWLADYLGRYTFKSENTFSRSILAIAVDRVVFNALVAQSIVDGAGGYWEHAKSADIDARAEAVKNVLTDPGRFAKYREAVEAEVAALLGSPPPVRKREKKEKVEASKIAAAI